MDPKIERLPIPCLGLGEGPHWSVETQSLYFVDILGCSIHRFDAKGQKYYCAKLDVPEIGFITPVAGSTDKFLVGGELSLYIVTWDGISDKAASIELLHTLPTEAAGNRINDGKCDPFGRACFGTMKSEGFKDEASGAFYSYSKGEGSRKHFSGIYVSNGMAWNLSKNAMYFIDTFRHAVDAYDYNNGDVGRRRALFSEGEFYPDGMTIDTDGNLWVACFTRSRVIKIDPESGKQVGQIDMPTPNITSCAWGGQALDELYVTSGGPLGDQTALKDDPNAGAVFRVTGLSARGLPMTHFKLL